MTQKLIYPELRHEVELRLHKLLPLMKEQKMDAMLIASNANIFYTSGRFFRGYVYLTASGKALWFVIRPNCFESETDVIPIRKPELIPSLLGEMGMPIPSSVGLELDVLSYSDCSRLQKIFPEATMMNASPLLREARLTKTPWEIEQMRFDGARQNAVYKKIDRLYKRDMTDVEFQIEIERVLRLEGSLGFLRVAGQLMEINLGSVICGANADAPSPYDFAMGGAGVSPALPCGASGEIMHAGESVMVDMNGCFNGYQTDMTRVWGIGELPELAMKAHACSIAILRELEKMALPGVAICELYNKAWEMAESAGLKDYFMGHAQKAGFIGHGVGIELNEQPAVTGRCRELLREGMTLALEPKFVVPGCGAVGVENTYVVRASGLENLTPGREEICNLL